MLSAEAFPVIHLIMAADLTTRRCRWAWGRTRPVICNGPVYHSEVYILRLENLFYF